MKMLDQIRRMLVDTNLAPPVAKLVGFTMSDVGEGFANFELEAGPQHANPMGTLHGGILCDLADAAMGVAWATLLEDDESFTTIELKINFLRPVWNGRLRAAGKVVQRGRTVGLVEARIVDDKDRLVAFATSSCLTLRGDQASGR